MPLPLVLAASTPTLGGNSSGLIWAGLSYGEKPGGQSPSTVSTRPAPPPMLRDTLSVTLPGSQDRDKALIAFCLPQGQRKQKQHIQASWDRQKRRAENTQRGGDVAPFRTLRLRAEQLSLELLLSGGQKCEAPTGQKRNKKLINKGT